MAGGSFFLAENSALEKSGALPTPGQGVRLARSGSVVVTVSPLSAAALSMPSVRASVCTALARLCACGGGLLLLEDGFDLHLHFVQRLQPRLAAWLRRE